jgi:glycosyltransferase involved in cell wall biosynthesis
VLHVHGLDALGAVPRAGRTAERVVLSPNLVRADHGPGGPVGTVRALVHRPHGRALARADALICESLSEARHLDRLQPIDTARVYVVPEGVERPAGGPHDGAGDGERPRMLVVGRLERRSPVRGAVAALAALPAPVRLTVLGEGRGRRTLGVLAGELGVAERIQWVPTPTARERHAWVRRAHVLVALTDRAGLDPAILEAASLGRPVVASDTPAHREAAEYAAPGSVRFVGPLPSPLAIADAVLDALDAQAPRPSGALVQPLRETLAQRLLEAYRTVLAAPPELEPGGPVTAAAAPTVSLRPGAGRPVAVAQEARAGRR